MLIGWAPPAIGVARTRKRMLDGGKIPERNGFGAAPPARPVA